MIVVGISAFYHDSAAVLLRDGGVVAAAEEERFSRIKHDASFPSRALAYCLTEAGVSLADVDHLVFYDKPFLKFERLLETHVAFAPRGFSTFCRAMPVWLGDKLFLKKRLCQRLRALAPHVDWPRRLLFSEHHLSHAASAFFPSPYEQAAVLTVDGVGEWATTSMGVGRGNQLQLNKEIHFPHSLGLLYSAVTQYLGFQVNADEYKVMGLAPYGEPRFAAEITGRLIDVKADGTFRLDMRYFSYCTGDRMISDSLDRVFDGPARRMGEPLSARYCDVAASIQAVTEEVLLRLARSIARETRLPNLCLAGGVALNCVANGRILRDGCFEQVWVQPAAGDSGGALGAALAATYGHVGQQRHVAVGVDAMQGALLGPAFPQESIERELLARGAVYEVLDDQALLVTAAHDLACGKILGWFQGRMEFGPRALGARSILADPRLPEMKATLNARVKHRESFRPFAPAVLREDAARWFALSAPSPYMTFAVPVRENVGPATTGGGGGIPAVTHVDGSARVQTVDADSHPRFHALLTAFKRETGCPVLVNTSFNVMGQPIVCTPAEAFQCFLASEIDVLALGNCYLRKEQQGVTIGR